MNKDEIIKKIKNKDLSYLIHKKNLNWKKISNRIIYEEELERLQIELVKLQKHIINKKERVIIIFEGYDAAGKGGSIRRFTHYLNPRYARVVALPKPTKEEQGQWYFQRYINKLPNPGEIVFFDRSWYNRAIVEPVNGFCSDKDYSKFMKQVNSFEKMLKEDNITVIKLWFSITKKEQRKRFKDRETNPLKQWKLSPVDKEAQGKWSEYTKYKDKMFSKTNESINWVIVKADSKQIARLESIRHVLSQFSYEHKDKELVSKKKNGIVCNFGDKDNA